MYGRKDPALKEKRGKRNPFKRTERINVSGDGGSVSVVRTWLASMMSIPYHGMLALGAANTK
jgi:hypothetical protein